MEIDPSTISLREDRKITSNTKVIGDLKEGVVSGGMFFKEGDTYIKTDGMVCADVLVNSMIDYYEIKSTKGVSESIAGRLLKNISEMRESLKGRDDDPYFSFCVRGEYVHFSPTIHNLAHAIFLSNDGVIEQNRDDSFSARLSGIRRRMSLTSRNVEAVLNPKAALLHKAFYELVCSGYYVSTKAHNRLAAVLARVYSDSSAASVFSRSGESRYVDLSALLEHLGYGNLAKLSRKGVIDFLSCSSSRFGFKVSPLLVSVLRAMSQDFIVRGNVITFRGTSYEFEDDIEDLLIDVSEREISFVRDMLYLCGSDTTLDVAKMTVDNAPNIILCMQEVCYEQ